MISYIEALEIIFQNLPALKPEIVSLQESANYYLASEIRSEENLPSFTNSAMDGYALRFQETLRATEIDPAQFKIIGQALAGHPFKEKIPPGCAVYIATGAPLPEGASTVAPIEYTRKESDGILHVLKPFRENLNIRFPGEDIKKGKSVFSPHQKIDFAQMGMLAALGRTEISVFKKPRIGFLATGDELVPSDLQPSVGQIRNSNTITIKTLVESQGFEFTDYGIAKDNLNDIKSNLNRNLPDVLITSAGVSIGEHDFVSQALKGIGLKVIFWKVAIKPGKPLLFGKIENSLYFGLPGNPVSAAVVFMQFIQPVLLALSGARKMFNQLIAAIADDDFRNSPNRFTFIRGFCYYDKEWRVKSAGKQDSHILSSLTGANAFVFVPPDQALKKNNSVCVQLWKTDKISFDDYKKTFSEWSF